MTKFNIGDKVRILDVDEIMYGRKYFRNGDITEITQLFTDGEPFLRSTTEQGSEMYVSQDEFHAIELVESTGNKHHDLAEEIAYLSKEVAKLSRRVVEIDTELLRRQRVGEDAKPVASPTLSPNELRKQAIEAAKDFVSRITEDAGFKGEPTDGNFTFKSIATVPEFIVNEEKRTVVALARGAGYPKLYEKGIAKCDPSDVFNADIGKAIALGRAYGLDVSEFVQAPQPSEIEDGQIITFPVDDEDGWYRKVCYRVDGVNKRDDDLIVMKDDIAGYIGMRAYAGASLGKLEIISDTEAQY